MYNGLFPSVVVSTPLYYPTGQQARMLLNYILPILSLLPLSLAIGVLTNVEKTANSSLFRIDAWNVSVSLTTRRKRGFANGSVCIGFEYHQGRGSVDIQLTALGVHIDSICTYIANKNIYTYLYQ